MLVTLEEAKTYLRVDSADEDELIKQLLQTSELLSSQNQCCHRNTWYVLQGCSGQVNSHN